jgi:hypothetical protein
MLFTDLVMNTPNHVKTMEFKIPSLYVEIE